MNKKQRYFDSTTTILQGILLLLLGIAILIGRQSFLEIFIYVLAFTFVGVGIVNSFRNIRAKTGKIIPIQMLYSIGNILAGGFIYYNPRIFMALFPILFTLYIFIDAVIKAVVFFIYKKNHITGRFLILVRSIVSFIFSCVMLFFPFIRYTATFIIAGVYFILLASLIFLME